MAKVGLEVIKLPGGLFDETSFRRVIRNIRAARAKDIKIDFDVTTQTWSNPPKAKIELIGDTVANIFIADERYTWVNEGTRPHPIPKTGTARLVFQANYKAKTVVRTIASTTGGPFGPTVYARAVEHPGTEARKFDEVIAEKWNRLLPGIVERAILAELG